MNEKFISVKEYAEKHGLSERTVRHAAKKIPGALKISGVWIIPENAPYPDDARIKSGKYINWRKKHE